MRRTVARAALALIVGCAAPPVAAPPLVGEVPPRPEILPGPDAPARLRFSEVQTANASTWMTSPGVTPDWIELVNLGTTPLPLADIVVEADAARGVAGTQGDLAPGQRLLLAADEVAAEGHLPFALASDGEDLTLRYRGVVTDRLRTGPLAPDLAWARFPAAAGTVDLDGIWLPTSRPTPGAPNGSRPPDTLDPSDLLFDTRRVHALELTLGEAARAALDANPYNDVDGAFAYEGLVYPCVGVRKKGVYGSLRNFTNKVGLKVDLNVCGGSALRGLETLTLNNMVQDPSSVHEALVYGWMRSRGLPAPRTGWARVSIDGQDFGFYAWIETPDENLLARWWDNPTGNLYEGAYGTDFLPGYEVYFEPDQSANPEDRSDLTAIVDVLQREPDDSALATLETLVDLDQFLDVMAVEAISLHWDGYSTANNYRIYRDPADGRFDWMTWGMDQTFVDRYLGPYDGRGALFTWCLRNRGCAVRYDAALLRAADDWEAAGLEATMDAHLALVTQQLETDPRREWGMDTHAGWVNATRAWILQAPTVMRDAVTARRRARAAGEVPSSRVEETRSPSSRGSSRVARATPPRSAAGGCFGMRSGTASPTVTTRRVRQTRPTLMTTTRRRPRRLPGTTPPSGTRRARSRSSSRRTTRPERCGPSAWRPARTW
jgi:hypothetical protein